MGSVPVRDASTVVLARNGARGLEVLLVERHANSRFAPGAFAFPGGRVEADDTPPDVESLCRGMTVSEAARILRDVRPTERAIGFWIAALREAFEEMGLLLAYDGSGAPFEPDASTRGRFAGHRARCRLGAGAFRRMLVREGLTLATDRMAYYAHWITPEERPIRFDTRFFVAASLPGELPEPDGVEVVGWRWLTPALALAEHRSGQITLPFSTQQILQSLADSGDVAALLRAARPRKIRPIRPRVVGTEGRERILLPDDPGYF